MIQTVIVEIRYIFHIAVKPAGFPIASSVGPTIRLKSHAIKIPLAILRDKSCLQLLIPHGRGDGRDALGEHGVNLELGEFGRVHPRRREAEGRVLRELLRRESFAGLGHGTLPPRALPVLLEAPAGPVRLPQRIGGRQAALAEFLLLPAVPLREVGDGSEPAPEMGIPLAEQLKGMVAAGVEVEGLVEDVREPSVPR